MEIKVNLSEKELVERYVTPYLNGDEIMINGSVIAHDKIRTVKITASEQSIDSLIEQITKQDKNEPDYRGLNFLKPSARSRALDNQVNVTDHYINQVPLKRNGTNKVSLNSSKDEYISTSRIEELKRIKNASFDLAKIIRLCEEININWHTNNYYSLIALVRTILHHVPPIFNLPTFEQLANNYTGGTSFKKSLQHLLNSSKNIADLHLHSQAQRNEVLPNDRQVDFRTDLDLLLSEIIRRTK